MEYTQDAEHGVDDFANEFAFSDKSIRKAFIRKVYLILAGQLLITFGMVSIFVFVQPVREFTFGNPGVYIAAFVLTIVMIILLGCFGNFRRKTPHNYIALLVFTLCEGYMLGCISVFFEGWQVLAAIGATIAVVLALTLFAVQTKFDFTMMGGFLVVFSLQLFIFGLFSILFRSQVLNILYACLGALLFCLYLIFDTQLIVGGNHKFTISPEEYIFAALNLYLDVVNIFIYILAIIGGSRN